MNVRCSLGNPGCESFFFRILDWILLMQGLRKLSVDLGNEILKHNDFHVHTNDNGHLTNMKTAVDFDVALTQRETILRINGTKWRLPSFKMYNFVGPSPSQVPAVFVISSIQII